MKKTLLQFGMIAIFLMGNLAANSQLLLEENFNYTSGVPLVEGAVASSDNAATTKTGWLTMSNSGSGTNCFNIANAGLTYTGYPASGIGKAMNILDNDGQDVFKTFSASNTNPTPGAAFPGPKTIYIAFMINVPAGDKSGAEYFAAIKYSNSATDANYMGRIFAKVTGNNVQFGISKSNIPTTMTWSGDYPVGTTHLLVLKYNMGGLNGANVTEETNKYDDKVDLFVNPALSTVEPVTSTLHYENAADKDAYRYGTSNTIIGGLAAMYFRTPATGAIPAATIDGIRVADTWAKLFTPSTGVVAVNQDQSVQLFVDQMQRKLNIDTKNAEYNQLEIFSITGIKVLEEKISQSRFDVELNSLKNGIYLVRFKNSKTSFSSKIMLN